MEENSNNNIKQSRRTTIAPCPMRSSSGSAAAPRMGQVSRQTKSLPQLVITFVDVFSLGVRPGRRWNVRSRPGVTRCYHFGAARPECGCVYPWCCQPRYILTSDSSLARTLPPPITHPSGKICAFSWRILPKRSTEARTDIGSAAVVPGCILPRAKSLNTVRRRSSLQMATRRTARAAPRENLAPPPAEHVLFSLWCDVFWIMPSIRTSPRLSQVRHKIPSNRSLENAGMNNRTFLEFYRCRLDFQMDCIGWFLSPHTCLPALCIMTDAHSLGSKRCRLQYSDS
jgi:hypothetical protein